MADIFAYEKRKEQIGERIKAMRKEKGFTQKQLAGYISDIVPTDSDKGFGQSTVSGWEKGKQLPPLSKLIALSEIFQCDISYILCDYDNKSKDVADVSRITGLSEQAVNILCYLKESNIGVVNVSPFGTQSANLSQVLDELIVSEEFVGMFKELGHYLAGNAVTIPPNQTIERPSMPDIIKFRAYAEQKGYKIAEKKDVAEVHLQIAADMLKTTFRGILKKWTTK